MWIGGALSSVCSIAGTEGFSIGRTGEPQIVGCVTGAGVNSVGVIKTAGKTTAVTTGSLIFHCVYVPMSDGAYIEAAV